MVDSLATWRLDFGAPKQTVVFASAQQKLPTVVYAGAALPSDARLVDYALADQRPVPMGTLDQIAPLSILPEEGRGFPGYCGLNISDAEGRPALTQFNLDGVVSDAHGIVFEAVDSRLGLTVFLRFQITPNSDVLAINTELVNHSDTRWRVDWLSIPVMPVHPSFTHRQEYRGRWTQEFTPLKAAIEHGVHIRESRRARTGHDHFPGLIVGEAPLACTRGRSAALHYAYSGIHRVVLESMSDGRKHVQAGVAECRWLEPGAQLHSGDGYWTYSSEGLNGIAHRFQSWVKEHIVDLSLEQSPRYVNYNCWEAIYFTHTIDRLKGLADSAAEVGAEQFVLDDGWFGTPSIPRNDDTSSLGDWFIDAFKYPDGLTPLVEHVNNLGMRFGIWFEPEMVNLNSDLATTHPDWVLTHGDIEHVAGRQQYLLDLSNQDVTDYLFERIDEMLSAHNVEYIKWDMNRDATQAVDAEGYRSIVRHNDAVFNLMQRIRKTHPQVEIESCASGGGRIDYRVLQNTQRVWLSDSIDARVRWKMQSEAFVFIPPSVYGSHVGAEQSHTSARIQPMSFRALVAMTGHMGIESDMAELTEADRDILMRYIKLYKQHRSWMHTGKHYRLDATQPENLSQLFVSEDQRQFLLFAGTLEVPLDETIAALPLVGLDTHADYNVTLVNKDDVSTMATREFLHPIMTQDSAVMSGAQLMLQGLVLPFPMPDSLWLVHGELNA